MQYVLHSVLYHVEQTASNTVGEQNNQNNQNKQNRTAYKSGGTRVRARRRRFKERSDRATPPGARAATIVLLVYRGLTSAAATVGTVLFCDVWTVSRARSAMMDVLIDEQELPEPVRLRAICVVPDEWEKLGRIRHRHQRTT